MFVSGSLAQLRNSHVLLAPVGASVPDTFSSAVADPDAHSQLLGEVQKLRGRIGVKEGAVRPSTLTADGRDNSPLDARSWHLVSLNEQGGVAGCMRMVVHAPGAPFESLVLSHTSIASCPTRGQLLRNAVAAEVQHAANCGATVVEPGGWVLDETRRRSTDGARLALGVWAWSRLIGGTVGLATATLRNHSSDMLQRIGGRPLSWRGTSFPPYMETRYGCEIQLLRFESWVYSPKYARAIDSLSEELTYAPVICATPALKRIAVATAPVGRTAAATAAAA